MGKEELDNLVKIERLKAEAASRKEYDGMLKSARTRLTDAQNETLDPDSRFDLAYGAAHRLALAALRLHGYRSENRITIFQTLVHTLGTDNADIQVFLKAHNERNLAEYEGRLDIDEELWLTSSAARKNWTPRCERSSRRQNRADAPLAFSHGLAKKPNGADESVNPSFA